MAYFDILRNNHFIYRQYLSLRAFGIHHFYVQLLKHDFKKHNGYKLNLNNPGTFNEKIQWLKCFYRDPVMIQSADKVGVREIIKRQIGEEFLVPVYGIYDNVDEININSLPKQFVLKPNHSSGRVIICNDKDILDWNSTKKTLKKWLKENYYYYSGEWVYKKIKPKIICEKLLNGDMIDYKFMCYHGIPQLLFTCTERTSSLKVTFYDMEFNKLPFIRTYPSGKPGTKPHNFEKMIEFSEILSKNFPFVRVDFYENEGNLYFGELTFFPGGGMEWFKPIEWDYKLGALLDLNKINQEYIITRSE